MNKDLLHHRDTEGPIRPERLTGQAQRKAILVKGKDGDFSLQPSTLLTEEERQFLLKARSKPVSPQRHRGHRERPLPVKARPFHREDAKGTLNPDDGMSDDG